MIAFNNRREGVATLPYAKDLKFERILASNNQVGISIQNAYGEVTGTKTLSKVTVLAQNPQNPICYSLPAGSYDDQ